MKKVNNSDQLDSVDLETIGEGALQFPKRQRLEDLNCVKSKKHLPSKPLKAEKLGPYLNRVHHCGRKIKIIMQANKSSIK